MGTSTDPVLFYGLIAEEGSEAYDKIVELRKDDEGCLGDFPETEECEISFIGFLDYCDYNVFVKDSYHSTYKGSVTIDPTTLTVLPDWDAKLAKFCEKFGLKLDKKPQWWLTTRTC